jgi:hypothetical protein
MAWLMHGLKYGILGVTIEVVEILVRSYDIMFAKGE